MKKLLLITVLFLLIKPIGFSQNFGAYGTVWHYSGHSYFPDTEKGFSKFESVKDTVIAGKITHQIVHTRTIQYTTHIMDTSYVYQKGDTVFQWNGGSDFRHKFVFNLNQGDTTTLFLFYSSRSRYLKYVVDTVFNIQIDGITLKQYELTNIPKVNPFETIKIIDRIGIYEFFHISKKVMPGDISFYNLRCYDDPLIDTNYNSFPCEFIAYTSLEENNKNINIKLHPNPTNNKISIQTDNNKPVNQIKIYSINGKLIKSFSFKNTDKTENLSVKELPSGIYFVQVLGEGFVGSLKFVKE